MPQVLTSTVLFYALWIVCGFGAVVFATAIRGWRNAVLCAAGFGAGAVVARVPGALDPEWVAALAAAVAVLALTWSRHQLVTSISCGLLAGLWAALFQVQGLPAAPAYVVAAAVPALAAWLAARRPAFAPAVLRDEGLLVVFALGVVVATAPAIAEGWRAAMNLTVEPGTSGDPVPVWTLALAWLSLASGGAYAMWSRR